MNKPLSKTMVEIYRYMNMNGGITQAEAFLHLGIGRLGARIFEMMERGIPIEAKMVPVTKKDGSQAFVARYELDKSFRDPRLEVVE